jgi:hypothetical protein
MNSFMLPNLQPRQIKVFPNDGVGSVGSLIAEFVDLKTRGATIQVDQL